MKIGDRRTAQGLGGVGGVCLATLLLAPGDATVAIGLVGLMLLFVALAIRLRTPESRGSQKRGCLVDLVLSGTASAVILALYSQIPQPADAPYRHNDGGDVALLILWPLAWLFLTFALGLWCQGCVYAHPPKTD